MYEALLKNTPEYQKTAASLASPGPAALFGLPPAGRALLYAALQKDTGRILCVVTPGEAEATHFADDLKTLGLSAAVFPPRDFMLRPVEGAGRVSQASDPGFHVRRGSRRSQSGSGSQCSPGAGKSRFRLTIQSVPMLPQTDEYCGS